MNKTLRKISAVLAIVVLIVSFGLGTVYADSGADFYRYFDIEDIKNDGTMKTTWPGGDSEPWIWHGTGAQVDTDSGSNVWRMMKNAQVRYPFPEIFESGVVRIGFDMKATKEEAALFLGIDAGDGQTYRWARYGEPIDGTPVVRLNKEVFAPNVTWGNTLPFTRGEWHRIDIVADYTGAKPLFQTYYDGEALISGSGFDISKIKGIKEFRFNVYSAVSDYNAGYILLDNFVFSRVDAPNLTVINPSDDKIENTNGEITLYPTERIDVSILTKENITITHKKTGAKVTNFSVEPDEKGDFFTLKFSGEVPAGRYEFIMSENVTGSVSGLSMAKPVEIRTEPKMVDGVEIPEISAIRVYDYKGNELIGTKLTSLTAKAEIEFNRSISENAKNKVVVLKDGEEFECIKTVEERDGLGFMVLTFDKLLDPNADYVIEVMEGIAAADSANAISEDSDKKSFVTDNDAGIVFYDKALAEDGKTYTFKVAKNTDIDEVYTFAVCGYTNKMKGGNVLPYLVKMGYKAINIPAAERGIEEYTIFTGEGDCDFTNEFVWRYPSLSNAELDENGKVK